MKKLKHILLGIPLLIVGGIAGIFFMPFLGYLKRHHNQKEQAFLKAYQPFLASLEGKNFFCYNNRNNSLAYIEQQILPQLNGNIQLIFLDGQTPVSDYPPAFMARLLLTAKHYQRFPHLIKIRDGQVLDKSINNAFYNGMNQGKDIGLLLGEMDVFFS